MIVRLVLERRISDFGCRTSGEFCARLRMFAQWFFLVAGLLAVGYTAFNVAARHIYQAYGNRVFDHAVALRQAAPRPPEDPAAPSQAGAVVVRSLVGKIEIPRLNISAIVKEGVDERTLDLAAGHIPHTALPGQPGNVGVAAHRDTLFRNLKDVRRDDKITLTTLDGEYVYRVVSFQIVQPTDVSVLEPSPDEKTLTLVTCYPFYFVGHAPKRFIVRAFQVFD
jgi:sortase A